MTLFPMWFKRRKRQRPPTPPWLLWVFIGFGLLGVIGNYHKGPGGAPSAVHVALQQAQVNLNPDRLFNLKEYKALLFPGSTTLRIKEVKPGAGQPVVCGQEVKLAYSDFLPNGQALPDTATPEAPLRFRIGDGTVMPVFEQGVLGMRPNGVRSVVAPAGMAYESAGHGRDDISKSNRYRFELNLLSATPAVPALDDSGFHIFTNRSGGIGSGLSCGEDAHLRVTVWSVEGKKLYAGSVTITLGKSQVFFGLEQGALGLNTGAARTLVVPPAFQHTLDGSAPLVDFLLPPAQTVLVDIESGA